MSAACEAWAARGVKLLLLDFDYTLASVHTGGSWHDGPESLAKSIRPIFEVTSHNHPRHRSSCCSSGGSPCSSVARDGDCRVHNVAASDFD